MTLRGATGMTLRYPITALIPFFVQDAVPDLTQKRCEFWAQIAKAPNKKVMIIAIGHWAAPMI